MLNQFSRTELLLGKDAMEKLAIPELPYSALAMSADIRLRHWQEAE